MKHIKTIFEMVDEKITIPSMELEYQKYVTNNSPFWCICIIPGERVINPPKAYVLDKNFDILYETDKPYDSKGEYNPKMMSFLKSIGVSPNDSCRTNSTIDDLKATVYVDFYIDYIGKYLTINGSRLKDSQYKYETPISEYFEDYIAEVRRYLDKRHEAKYELDLSGSKLYNSLPKLPQYKF